VFGRFPGMEDRLRIIFVAAMVLKSKVVLV